MRNRVALVLLLVIAAYSLVRSTTSPAVQSRTTNRLQNVPFSALNNGNPPQSTIYYCINCLREDGPCTTAGVGDPIGTDALLTPDGWMCSGRAAGAGAGTVTSIGASGPAGLLTWSSAVTTSGTLTATLSTQTTNTVFASLGGVPAFRALVAADLPNTAVTPGAYTTADITVDAQGRITAAATGSGGGGGGVSSVTGTTPIASTGGATPAISIANAMADGSTKGASTYTAADFNSSSGLISIDYANGLSATGSVKGFLTAADWTAFDAKQAGPLTGDVTTSGAAATIANSVVTYAKMQNVSAASRLLGRGDSGSGAVQEVQIGSGLTMTGLVLSASGSGLPSSDAVSVIEGSLDGTKELRFEVDGFTTSTIRVLTPPNYDGAIATLAGTETFSGKTFIAPKFADLGFIADANGNEMVVFDTVPSAVNYLKVTNSATGTAVEIAPAGDDAVIDFHIGCKGAGCSVVIGEPGGTTSSLDFLAMTAPATPGTGLGKIYVDSTSKNLAVKDDAGVVKHGVRTLAVVGGQCVTGIADDGTVSTAACASGSGTVTVVSSGSLTSTALVTGGGTTTLQTPSATATLASNGNISTPGTITALGFISTGTGPGYSEYAQEGGLGFPALVADRMQLTTVADVAAGGIQYRFAGTAATGIQKWANSTGIMTGSIAAVDLASADVTGNLPDANIPNNITVDLATLATNVTTNANLTGHVTSTGNAAVLGSFTVAQLNTAISDADIARTDAANTFTGTQTFGAITQTGQHIISLNGAASTPPLTLTGTIFTGGTATTTKPQLLIEPTGTTSTGWATGGTGLGVNAASGFTGSMADFKIAGVTVGKLLASGAFNAAGVSVWSSGAVGVPGNQKSNLDSNLALNSTSNIYFAGGATLDAGYDLTISRAGASTLRVGNGSADNALGTIFAAKHQTATSVFWSSGTGTPEAAVTANIGSLFTRTDGGASTTLYVKESGTGNTGWVAAGAGSGSGTINAGATNIIPKYTASTTLDDSLLSDNGTTLSYTGAFAATTTVSAAGYFEAYTTVTNADLTLTAAHSFVGFITGNTNRAAPIPSGATAGVGRVYTIAKLDTAGTGTVTVTPASGTIDGAASMIIEFAGGGVSIISDGTNWTVK